jgi:hypothetical protein
MKNSGINAYFRRILPIRGCVYSKKLAFNQAAGISVVRAKVSDNEKF